MYGKKIHKLLAINGALIDLVEPNFWNMELVDFAHPLSILNRFTGNTIVPYSVAQHSVHVAELVESLTEGDPLVTFAALLHDAAEVFVGDVPGPMKGLCPGYKEVEERLDVAIADRFGLPLPRPAIIKQADLMMLQAEMRDLTAGPLAAHASSVAAAKEFNWPPASVEMVQPWAASHAFIRFMSYANDLLSRMGR